MRYGNPLKKTRTVSSTKGHTIEFPGRGTIDKKDLPPADPKHKDRATIIDADGVVYVYVPPIIRADVEHAGMQPETEIEEADEPKGVVKPDDAEELKKGAYEAFDILVAAGDRESFGGNGVPKAAAVEKLLGYPLTTGEIKDLWPKYQVERSEK